MKEYGSRHGTLCPVAMCELHLTGKHKALAIVGKNVYLEEEKRELKEAHEKRTKRE